MNLKLRFRASFGLSFRYACAMAGKADVRNIALTLPHTRERANDFAFETLGGGKYRLLAWVWKERVDPRKPRVPNPKVLAVRVADLDTKELLLQSDSRKFFTEAHYDGYAAVLVRLKEITRGELHALLHESWKTIVSRPERKTRHSRRS